MSDGTALADLLLPDARKNIFIEVVSRIFPGFIAGILLSAIIAAAMSTADSQLLVASSAFTSDIYKPLVRKNKASDSAREFMYEIEHLPELSKEELQALSEKVRRFAGK